MKKYRLDFFFEMPQGHSVPEHKEHSIDWSFGSLESLQGAVARALKGSFIKFEEEDFEGNLIHWIHPVSRMSYMTYYEVTDEPKSDDE